MKILNLQAENIKKLVAVEIAPDDNLVQITGRNGQGKTSVLDAIWWALCGKDNVQTTPVRKGEEKAMIRLDLGDLVVTRRFNAKDDGSYTTSIIVENAEGARYPSPQSTLDALIGSLSFDPLAFSRLAPRDRVAALRGLVKGFDFTQAEQQIKAAFEDRTGHNRDATRLRATAEELGKEIPEGMPEVESLTALVDELESARVQHALVLEAQNEATTADNALHAIDNEMQELTDRLHELQGERPTAVTRCHNARAALAAAGETPDLEGIDRRLDAAKDLQGVRQAIAQRDKALADAEAAEGKSEALTREIEAIKARAAKAIAEADLPVDGVTISDGEIMLNGIPFPQASDAEQLRTSVALAMAMNPTLRVIRVRDGSLLDDDALALMAQMADTADYQIWVERVDSSGKVGIVMEDGHVKEQDGEQKGEKRSLFGRDRA